MTLLTRFSSWPLEALETIVRCSSILLLLPTINRSDRLQVNGQLTIGIGLPDGSNIKIIDSREVVVVDDDDDDYHQPHSHS